MNRRDFLGILTATPFMADSLFANSLLNFRTKYLQEISLNHHIYHL
jgi:hypothetical protein